MPLSEFLALCQRCGKTTQANFCQDCRRRAFSCAFCHQAVQGTHTHTHTHTQRCIDEIARVDGFVGCSRFVVFLSGMRPWRACAPHEGMVQFADTVSHSRLWMPMPAKPTRSVQSLYHADSCIQSLIELASGTAAQRSVQHMHTLPQCELYCTINTTKSNLHIKPFASFRHRCCCILAHVQHVCSTNQVTGSRQCRWQP
jgi:hypothetical protein